MNRRERIHMHNAHSRADLECGERLDHYERGYIRGWLWDAFGGSRYGGKASGPPDGFPYWGFGFDDGVRASRRRRALPEGFFMRLRAQLTGWNDHTQDRGPQ